MTPCFITASQCYDRSRSSRLEIYWVQEGRIVQNVNCWSTHWHVLVGDEKWLSANFQRRSCWKISIIILAGASSIRYHRVTATLPSNWSLCCQEEQPHCVWFTNMSRSPIRKNPPLQSSLAIAHCRSALLWCTLPFNSLVIKKWSMRWTFPKSNYREVLICPVLLFFVIWFARRTVKYHRLKYWLWRQHKPFLACFPWRPRFNASFINYVASH